LSDPLVRLASPDDRAAITGRLHEHLGCARVF